MIRKTIAPIAVVLTLGALSATFLTGSTSAAHRKYTIVAFVYDPANGVGGRAAARALGMRFITAPSTFQLSPQQQNRYYKSMIARHVDATVNGGYDPRLAPLLDKVRKAGILSIAWEDDVAAKRDLWVSLSSPVANARALGDALASQIHGKGEYAILDEQGEFPIAHLWKRLVVSYIPKAYPKMKLDGMLTETGVGDQAEADSIKSFMSSHPNLRGLLAITPTEAYMAAEAIQQAGRIGQVYSAGNGGTALKDTPLVDWIRIGALEDVVGGDPVNIGYATVWAAHYLLTGHHFRPGAYQVGGSVGLVYYYAKHQELRVGQPITITKKNVDHYARRF